MRLTRQIIETWVADAPTRRDLLPVILLLAVVALFAWRGTVGKSNTADELVHVLSGHAALHLGDYRLNPENGTIPCRIAAVPLQFMDSSLNLDTSSTEWRQSNQWHLGCKLWFQSPVSHQEILKRSRLSMLLFNLTGIALVFLWSGNLWGRGGAYLSLLLAGFSPNFLGHLPLATSDMAGTWTLVLAASAYSSMINRLTLPGILLSGLTASLAVLCKHSGILIAPVAACLLLWRTFDGRPLGLGWFRQSKTVAGISGKLGWLLLVSLLAALISYAVLWSAYGFRYSAANPDVGQFSQFQIHWSMLEATSLYPVIGLLRKFELLPEAFLYGLNFILYHDARAGFLNGVFSTDGFRLYHAWTFIYKTPIPTMIILFLGMGCLVALIRKDRKITNNKVLRAMLLVLMVYGLMLLNSRISIGHRHAFPILYVAFILAGSCLKPALNRGMVYAAGVVLTTLSLVPLSWANIDRTISYMNPIGGGETGGYKRLNDSSLDWGQDLPSAVKAIKAYQQKYPDGKVYFSYFGTADPQSYGLEGVQMVHAWGIYGMLDLPDFFPRFEPGLYVISATEMDAMLSDWSLDLEVRYQSLKKVTAGLYEKLDGQMALASITENAILTDQEFKALDNFEALRAQRLKVFLLQYEPDQILHGSILLFNLSNEAIQAFEGTPESGN